MPVFGTIYHRCSKCRETLPDNSRYETIGTLFVGLGPMVVECSRCRTPNRLTRVYEWDLMPWSGRLVYCAGKLLWGTFFGFAAGAVVGEKSRLGNYGALVGTAVGWCVCAVLLGERVAESRRRLKKAP